MAQSERGWFGYCGHHEEVTDEETYRYKGCWGCQHFEFGEAFPYVFVSEAAEELHVSESTVRRLIKKGKLNGELFKQVRITRSLPSPAKYHISKESLKEFPERTILEHDIGNKKIESLRCSSSLKAQVLLCGVTNPIREKMRR